MSAPRVACVGRARSIALAFVTGELIAAVLVAVAGPRPSVAGATLVPPAGLFGIVAPVIGYRLYLYLGEASSRPLEARFVAATTAALAVTSGAATLGLVTFYLSARPVALIGLVTHVLLAGAVWPTPERLDAFERSDG